MNAAREEDWGELCRGWNPGTERIWVFTDSRKGETRNGAGRVGQGKRPFARLVWAALVILGVVLGSWWVWTGRDAERRGAPLVAEWQMGNNIQMVWVWTQAFPE